MIPCLPRYVSCDLSQSVVLQQFPCRLARNRVGQYQGLSRFIITDRPSHCSNFERESRSVPQPKRTTSGPYTRMAVASIWIALVVPGGQQDDSRSVGSFTIYRPQNQSSKKALGVEGI